MNKTVFSEIAEINRNYSERIKEADRFGRKQIVAELSDEHCQFLCDASRELSKRAKSLKELLKQDSHADCIDIGLKGVKSIQEYAQLCSDQY